MNHLRSSLLTFATVGIASKVLCESGIRVEVDRELQNWSHTFKCTARNVFKPQNINEVSNFMTDAYKRGQKVKIMGSGLSPNGIGLSNGDIICLEDLNNIVSVDKEKKQVTVQAGMQVGELVDELRDYKLTLQNLASINQQQIGGLTQVGAHGTGARIPPTEEQIISMKVVDGTGNVHSLSKGKQFDFTKCGFGTLGAVCELTLQCVDAHKLKESIQVFTRRGVQVQHIRRLKENKHVRYMWIPYVDAVVVVTSNDTTENYTNTRDEEGAKLPFFELARKLNLDTASFASFGDLRNELLEAGDGFLDVDHVKRVNLAESNYWKMLQQGEYVDDSDAILAFDCGGQQLVHEVAVDCGTLDHPNTNDMVFMTELLHAIESQRIPAPAPIEQRWTTGSSANLSPVYSPSNPDMKLFTWVGVIQYLPVNNANVRHAIMENFNAYRTLVSDCSMNGNFNARTHWAKIDFDRERKYIDQVLGNQEYLDLRNCVDPGGIFVVG